MKPYVDAEGSQYPFPSLDTKSTSARYSPFVVVSPERKRARRAFHRVMSGLSKRGNVRFMTLTTAAAAGDRDFQRDFRKLRMRLLRRKLLVDYIRVPQLTESGLRHDHILFRGNYIDQAYLSKLWLEIHKSPVVDIRGVGMRRRKAAYLARYVAAEHTGRLSWSWGWVWKGFCRSWTVLKRFSRSQAWSYTKLLQTWTWCVINDREPRAELAAWGYHDL